LRKDGAPAPTPAAASNPEPRGSFRYPFTDLTLTPGRQVSVPGPSGKAWHGAVFTVEPRLPHGLDLVQETGALVGFPKLLSPETVYTVTATKGGEVSTATVRITVKDQEAAAAVGEGSASVNAHP
jgi:hypothetical protein